MSAPAGDCGWQRLLFGFRNKSQSSKQHYCESTAHCGRGQREGTAMQSSSRSSYIFPRRAKLIATKVGKRRLRETVAAWVLMLALALVVTVAAVWLSKWLDENAKLFSPVFLTTHRAIASEDSKACPPDRIGGVALGPAPICRPEVRDCFG